MRQFHLWRSFVTAVLWGLVGILPAYEALADQPANPAGAKGALFIIGGGATSCVREFVALAGGQNASIAILTHASSEPEKEGDVTENQMLKFGATRTRVIHPDSKVGLPKDCNAVYFIGGDQVRLLKHIDAQLLQQIREFLRDGGLVGGTSAGAAAVAETMIAGNTGEMDYVLRAGELQLVKGLGLLPGVIVDTHVRERVGRVDRLLDAVSRLPVIGIGLDEDTAVYVKGGVAKVYGTGHVRLYKRGSEHESDAKTRPDGANASVWNVLLSVIAAGQEFNL